MKVLYMYIYQLLPWCIG